MSKRDTDKTISQIERELARMEGYRMMLRNEGDRDTPANDAERERLREKLAVLKARKAV